MLANLRIWWPLALWQSPDGLWRPSNHSTLNIWLPKCCWGAGLSPITAEDLWSSFRLTVDCHLPDQGPSCALTQFVRTATSKKGGGGFKLVPFHNYSDHYAPENTRNGFRIYYALALIYSSTQNVSQGSTETSLGFTSSWFSFRKIVDTSVCPFPNNVRSVQFDTGGPQERINQTWHISCLGLSDDMFLL